MLKFLNEVIITFILNIRYVFILFVVAFIYHLLFK